MIVEFEADVNSVNLSGFAILDLTLSCTDFTSVADPDHFHADPDLDPTSEKTGCGFGSDHALNKIF
jgi:hypothetical protein